MTIEIKNTHIPSEWNKEQTYSSQGFELISLSDILDDEALNTVPQMLLDTFWFEGEIAILFSVTNSGKSVLAYAVADAISKGKENLEGMRITTKERKVCYLDFEMSDRQLKGRYSIENSEGNKYTNTYKFDKNLYRPELRQLGVGNNQGQFVDTLVNVIENTVLSDGVKIWIIDNITWLDERIEKGENAARLMKHLVQLKDQYGLSILLLGHTPKRYGLSRPIDRDDLTGSSQILNFTDAAFAIGLSKKDSKLRYLKQIKVRSSEHIYTSEKVVNFEIGKRENFLGFWKLAPRFSHELDHIKSDDEAKSDELILLSHQLKSEGWSNTKIAKHIGVSEGTVRNYLKKPASS